MGDAHPELESHGPAARRRHRPGRLNTLSDGIFAIAMTLLALEIQVPDGAADEAAFGQGMLDFFGSLGVFVVAFFLTAQYWLGHHRVLSYVHTVDRRALEKAVVSLLGIAALPAATRLIVGTGGHWQAIVTAAGILAVTSLTAVRFYAHVLRDEFAEIDAATRRTVLIAPLYNVGIYVLTIVATLVLHATDRNPGIAFALWFLLPLNGLIVRRLRDRRGTAPSRSSG